MTQWSDVKNDEEEKVYTTRWKFEEVERMTPKHLLKPGRYFQSKLKEKFLQNSTFNL